MIQKALGRTELIPTTKVCSVEHSWDVLMQTITKLCPNYRHNDDLTKIWYEIWYWFRTDEAKGLLLWGPVGTGKSTIVRVLAEYDRRIRGLDDTNHAIGGFKLINCTDICKDYSIGGVDFIKTYTNFVRGFDELGREPIPSGFYGTSLNVMQYIFQLRYDNHCRTFITTNLKPEAIAKIYGEHIYDRCKEMFHFVEVKGSSFRK